MSAAAKWSIAIVVLLGGNLIAMVVLATTASRDDAQVIPGYYDKAVHYDDTIDEAARSTALGWSTASTLIASTLEVRVTDRAGQVLDGARVRVAGYPRARGRSDRQRADRERSGCVSGTRRWRASGDA